MGLPKSSSVLLFLSCITCFILLLYSTYALFLSFLTLSGTFLSKIFLYASLFFSTASLTSSVHHAFPFFFLFLTTFVPTTLSVTSRTSSFQNLIDHLHIPLSIQ